MPSLKDLRDRIKSVKSTRQITKTMKMVAAAKMRKAEGACENARPYAVALDDVLQNLAAQTPEGSAPVILKGRKNVQTVRLIVFGSNRGLCGGFNVQIARAATKAVADYQRQGKNVQLVTVGSKMFSALKTEFNEHIVHRDDAAATEQTYGHAEELGQLAINGFTEGVCDEVHILYNSFVNVMTQKPTFKQLIPFKSNELAEETLGDDDAQLNASQPTSQAIGQPNKVMKSTPEYEPDEEQILATLLPLNVNTQIFAALLESGAAEQGARMAAMDSATRNAGDMISSLSLNYNRQRQANITSELTEIVAGAESV